MAVHATSIERTRFGIALHAASLSAFAGSAISAILLCGVMILDGSQVRSLTDAAFLPIVGFIAGLLGLIVALPASLLIGAPLLWIGGSAMQVQPRRYALLLASVGALAGWATYGPFFSGGLGAISKPARYACPLFGAVVAGLRPFILAWIARGAAVRPSPPRQSARL
jgi:hypothetical protein